MRIFFISFIFTLFGGASTIHKLVGNLKIIKRSVLLCFVFMLWSGFSQGLVSLAEENNHIIVKREGQSTESLESLSKRLNELNQDIQNLRDNEKSIQTELQNNELTLLDNQHKKEETLKNIRLLLAEIEEKNQEYQESVERYYKREELLRKKLITLQNESKYNEYLHMLLESKSFSNFFDRLSAMMVLAEADQDSLRLTIEEQYSIKSKKFELERKLVQLEKLKVDLIIQTDALNEQSEEKETLLKQIQDMQQKLLQEKQSVNDQIQLSSQLIESTMDTASTHYANGVPAEYVNYYKTSGNKYGVDWYILAAIHSVETTFSTHTTMISSAGAIGHMQFMPLTWIGYKYDDGNGRAPAHIDITDLNIIKLGGGYGTDGDGDGKADPFNLADSIESAAKYLASNGYSKNPAKAIFQYNHAQWYVDEVLNEATRIKHLNQ